MRLSVPLLLRPRLRRRVSPCLKPQAGLSRELGRRIKPKPKPVKRPDKRKKSSGRKDARGDASASPQRFRPSSTTRWEGGLGARDWLGNSLKPGKHTIEFDFTCDGPGIAKGGTGIFKVDGRDLATEKLEHTIPFLLPADETFDVGVDTRTPVDSSYEIPFRFNGKIDKLTFKLGPTQLTSDDRKVIQHALATARD
jgi:hypothetical protein